MIYNFDFDNQFYDKVLETINFNEGKQEREIFDLKRRGYYNIQIGIQLNMSERTVSRRLQGIYKKMQRAKLIP